MSCMTKSLVYQHLLQGFYLWRNHRSKVSKLIESMNSVDQLTVTTKWEFKTDVTAALELLLSLMLLFEQTRFQNIKLPKHINSHMIACVLSNCNKSQWNRFIKSMKHFLGLFSILTLSSYAIDAILRQFFLPCTSLDIEKRPPNYMHGTLE